MPELLGAAEIRRLAGRLDLTPTKKLGQNFVIDANTVRRIVRLAGLSDGETVLEVGPGLGSLTLGILEAGHRVVAVEIDERLAELLPETVATFGASERCAVIRQDAMTLREYPANVMAKMGEPTALVANLPYNVSVPVLLHLLVTFPALQRAMVMVQAEVGHRIAARPGSKIYGAPSVKAAWFGDWSVASQVSRQIFWPVPNVDSVLVGFNGRREPGDATLRTRTFQLVDAAFGQRRKTLRQALASFYGSPQLAEAALTAAGISPAERGENLVLDDFLALARAKG